MAGMIQNEAAYEAAVRRRILANARKTQPQKLAQFTEDHPEVVAFLNGRLPQGSFGEMLLNFRTQLDDFGRLSDKQVAVVERAIAKRAEWTKKADAERAQIAQTSGWVGTPKERRTWELTVKSSYGVEGYNGTYWINTCEDASGNQIVYKGVRWEPGSVVITRATVKDHSEYRGVKQTIINRPR